MPYYTAGSCATAMLQLMQPVQNGIKLASGMEHLHSGAANTNTLAILAGAVTFALGLGVAPSCACPTFCWLLTLALSCAVCLIPLPRVPPSASCAKQNVKSRQQIANFTVNSVRQCAKESARSVRHSVQRPLQSVPLSAKLAQQTRSSAVPLSPQLALKFRPPKQNSSVTLSWCSWQRRFR